MRRLPLATALALLAVAAPAHAQSISGGCPFGASSCTVTATGSPTARTLADRAAEATNIKDFVPAGYALGTLTGGNPTPLSALYGSLAAAQAAFPGVTIGATTQYIDRVILQYAINQVQANGCGNMKLPFVTIYIDAQIVDPAACVHLQGTQGVSGFVRQTELRTQSMAANTAAVSLVGASFSGSNGSLGLGPVLSQISFEAFNAGLSAWSAPGTGGVAETGFVTNSVALDVSNASNGTVTDGVVFTNYDKPHSWSTGNDYILTFNNTWYSNNNYGIYFGAPLSNSFERMTWTGGGMGNNNYGAYINLPGGGADIYLDHMSIDYNIVNEIWFTGLSGGSNDDWTSLFLTDSHLETSDVWSGTTTARIYNNGNMFISNSEGFENGSNPVGWIAPEFFARTTIANTLVPGVDNEPVVYLTGTPPLFVQGTGLFQRFGQDVLLIRSGYGDFMQSITPQAYIRNASFHPALVDQQHPTLLSGTINITIDPDSTTNQAIGTTLVYKTTDALIKTLVQGAGVTITSVGTGLTFGGKAGKVVGLTKTGANTWIATGDMI